MSACLFRAQDLHQTVGILKSFGNGFAVTPDVIRHFQATLFFGLPLLVMEIWQYRSNDLLVFARQKSSVRFAGYLFAIFMILYVYLFTADIKGGEEFIYFQF